MVGDPNGDWCEWTEASNRITALEESVRVLAKECKKAKFAFSSHVEVCSLAMNVNWAHVRSYNMACEATDNNPIAAEAVLKAGG
jgi:hypothetical protein